MTDRNHNPAEHDFDTPLIEATADVAGAGLDSKPAVLSPGQTLSVNLAELESFTFPPLETEGISGVVTVISPSFLVNGESQPISDAFFIVRPSDLPPQKLEVQVIPANVDESTSVAEIETVLATQPTIGIFDVRGLTSWDTDDSLLDLMTTDAAASVGTFLLMRVSAQREIRLFTRPSGPQASDYVIGRVTFNHNQELTLELPADLAPIDGVTISDVQVTIGRRAAIEPVIDDNQDTANASPDIEASTPTVLPRILMADPPAIEPLPERTSEPTNHFAGEVPVIVNKHPESNSIEAPPGSRWPFPWRRQAG